jgi:molybdenum-dependent DNA-binding transcriptional regulator ModE
VGADSLGCHGSCPRDAGEAIGASYGDALMAPEGVGVAPKRIILDQSRGTRGTGRRATRALRRPVYARYRALYPTTREIQHALARMQISASDP